MPSTSEASDRSASRGRKLSSKLSFSSLSMKSANGNRKGAATPNQRSSNGGSGSGSVSHRHRQQPSQHSIQNGTISSVGSKGVDGNTIAHLYAVFGLPKDPAVWTMAEEDCVAGVHHVEGAVGRFWRPEVLGCSIAPPPSGPGEAATASSDEISRTISNGSNLKKEGVTWDSDAKKSSNPKFIEMTDGRGGLERAETARVLSKALKLSFTREIEVTTGPGNYPPMSSSHTFSFSVPTIKSSAPSFKASVSADQRKTGVSLGVSTADMHKNGAASAVGEGYGLEGMPSNIPGLVGTGGEVSTGTATFYGVVLTVWSAADDKRAKAIKKELNRAAKARASARNGKSALIDADDAENQDDDLGSTVHGYSFLPENNTFFMPYAICLVSRYPIYNLLGDWNKAAWHKYSRNIEMHNKLMAAILRQPAPRLGETFRLESPDEDLQFVCTFPGALDWGRGLISIDFVMWPLFKTLSIDNILTICEIALSPSGRILFLSRHPALLGVAVETIKYLIELCGWKGVAHQICHARDIKIYLEDPGSWLIAINTELRSIVKPAKEVCVVDLDINFVNCPRPPLKAPSVRSIRDKKRRKLVNALGFSSADYGPPREITDAFPAGRLRPLSKVESKSGKPQYERLDVPQWWDQGAVLTAFDQVLHEGTKPSFLKKVLKMRAEKQPAVSATEMAAIVALRKRASTFVDARDGLENKIGRLNKRLAFLMSEGDMWKQQFEKIQQLVDRLTKEANDLRLKVDKERRESRRLSTTLQQRDLEQVQLQIQLRDTEMAREKAQGELARMRDAMDSLEHEREAMMDEIRNVVSSSGVAEFDFGSLSKLEMMADSSRRARSNSPASAMSHNSEISILKSRALAEQRISMGRPRTGGSGRISGGSRLGHGSQNGHVATSSKQISGDGNGDGSVPNRFSDEQMNSEIQNRTSAVTDQISRIQQQLESTLTHLESRRSMTFDRERRRLSNSSSNSFRYDYMGPPSSIGHHAGHGATSIGHGTEISSPHAAGSSNYDAVESIQEHREGSDARSVGPHGTPRRTSVAPPSSFRGPGASPNAARQSAIRASGSSVPALGPKHPARRASASLQGASATHERDSPLASSHGHDHFVAAPSSFDGTTSTDPTEQMSSSIELGNAKGTHSREASGTDSATLATAPASIAADADVEAPAAAGAAAAVTAAAAITTAAVLPAQTSFADNKEVLAQAKSATGDTIEQPAIVADTPADAVVEESNPSNEEGEDASKPAAAVAPETDATEEKETTLTKAETQTINEGQPQDGPEADRGDGDGDDEDGQSGDFDMFAEPDSFRPKTPPPTVTHYEFPGSDAKVTLNLVGSHPLWGHLAWNASFIMSDFLCAHANKLVKGLKVLELGAAAGLPSIVCNWAEASHVVATDYPDPDLLANLRKNVQFNCGEQSESPHKGPGYAAAEGYIWGTDSSKVLSHLSTDGTQKFDLILMSDLVFNHQAHPALLDTCEQCLADPVAGKEDGDALSAPSVLVFFTHHRPHLAYKDMGFFDMAEVKGWTVQKLGEWFREPMFPDDPGDEQVRSTIHGYRLYRGGNDELNAEEPALPASTD